MVPKRGSNTVEKKGIGTLEIRTCAEKGNSRSHSFLLLKDVASQYSNSVSQSPRRCRQAR